MTLLSSQHSNLTAKPLFQVIKDGPARTTGHIYLAFKYLLTQRHWDLSIWSNAETFWTHLKKRISSPEHRCVRFMMTTKKPFLQMMEREMFDTDCEAWSQAISMDFNIGSSITRPFPPTIPGYDENHPAFNDVKLIFNAWLMVEDRGDECLRNILEEQDGKLQDVQGDGIRELAAAVRFRQRRMSDPGATSTLLLAKTGSLGLRRATTSSEIGRPVEQTASNYVQATPQGEDVDMNDAETVVHPRSMLDGTWVAAQVPSHIQTFNPVTSRKRVADFDLSDASPNEPCWPNEDIEMGQREERAAKRPRMNGSRTSRSLL
jgi:hypothetical protein